MTRHFVHRPCHHTAKQWASGGVTIQTGDTHTSGKRISHGPQRIQVGPSRLFSARHAAQACNQSVPLWHLMKRQRSTRRGLHCSLSKLSLWTKTSLQFQKANYLLWKSWKFGWLSLSLAIVQFPPSITLERSWSVMVKIAFLRSSCTEQNTQRLLLNFQLSLYGRCHTCHKDWAEILHSDRWSYRPWQCKAPLHCDQVLRSKDVEHRDELPRPGAHGTCYRPRYIQCRLLQLWEIFTWLQWLHWACLWWIILHDRWKELSLVTHEGAEQGHHSSKVRLSPAVAREGSPDSGALGTWSSPAAVREGSSDQTQK